MFHDVLWVLYNTDVSAFDTFVRLVWGLLLLFVSLLYFIVIIHQRRFSVGRGRRATVEDLLYGDGVLVCR